MIMLPMMTVSLEQASQNWLQIYIPVLDFCHL